MEKIIAVILVTALVVSGLSSIVFAQDSVNVVLVIFQTQWVYDTLEDTFANEEVTGRKEWSAGIYNRPDGTGEPVTALTISLASDLEFAHVDPPPDTMGPPTYDWYSGNVAEEEAVATSVAGATPEVPVTFGPRFDASRSADKTEFSGVGTQNLTIAFTPLEVTGEFREYHIFVDAYGYGLVDPAITGVSGPADDISISGDGRMLHMGHIEVTDLDIGTTYCYHVTINVTPAVPKVDFMPTVHVMSHYGVLEAIVSGSSVSYPADPVDEVGNWTCSAENGYAWALMQQLTKKVNFQGYARIPPVIIAAVDIKPGSCRNPLNTNSKGVLPVAILGSDDFHATQVAPASVSLEGVAPLHWALEDVAGPECSGPDGYLDLTVKFKTQEIAAALGAVDDGDVLSLELTGNLLDSTPIMGSDQVWIIEKR